MGDAVDVGDLAQVDLTCEFDVWTPIISAVVGDKVSVSSSSSFPIKTGQFASGGGSGSPTLPGPAFSADYTTGAPPHTVQFSDESGGCPCTYVWNFGDGIGTSTEQDPLYVYGNPGIYDVTLTVTNGPGSSASLTKDDYISVSTSSTYNFTSDKTSGPRPLTVQFTDQSGGGPTAWNWAFGDGQTSTVQNPSHIYNVVGTYTVSLDVTTPTGTGQAVKNNYISVEVGPCTVPNYTSKPANKRSEAQPLWSAAGFTTTVQDRASPPPNNDYPIGFQSLAGNSTVPCDATIQVDK